MFLDKRQYLYYNSYMSYTLLPHTADIRLKIENKTIKGLVKDALLGMMEIMVGYKLLTPTFLLNKQANRKITLNSLDQTTLLVDFLNKVLLLCYIKHEIYRNVYFYKLTQRSLKAKLIGFKVEEFRKDIKAVTYHEAQIHQNKCGNFKTIIIFDI
ncbi:MAG: archease [Candidatus Omnitrophica bacterium]|nr:archease [Candidatus Omnitrophota bacterium]